VTESISNSKLGTSFCYSLSDGTTVLLPEAHIVALSTEAGLLLLGSSQGIWTCALLLVEVIPLTSV
jgi:hypothetical protein